MSKVGQIEKKTEERLITLFKEHLRYEYLGNQGHNPSLINKVLRGLDRASIWCRQESL